MKEKLPDLLLDIDLGKTMKEKLPDLLLDISNPNSFSSNILSCVDQFILPGDITT
jgi:hypothetical protein